MNAAISSGFSLRLVGTLSIGATISAKVRSLGRLGRRIMTERSQDKNSPSRYRRKGFRLPYRPRWPHRLYAGLMGYFWIPCPLCGDPFGGQETTGAAIGKAGRPPNEGMCVCPRCVDRPEVHEHDVAFWESNRE